MASENDLHPHLMFVYGTLKRGQPNARQMAPSGAGGTGSAVFVGCGQTVEKFPLVVATAYNIPFLLKEQGQGHNVKGELYRVDDAMLQHLDDFEVHPRLYLRQEAAIFVTHDQDGSDVTPPRREECWVYILSRRHPEMLRMNYLSEYNSGDPGTPAHVARADRDGEVPLIDLVFPQQQAADDR